MSSEEDDLRRPALFIEDTDDDFDLDIPPTSGSEYLRRVQLEARQCPAIVVANIDASIFHKKQTVTFQEGSGLQPAPAGFAPSVEWQRQQAANFSSVRLQFARCKSKLKERKTKPKRTLPDKTDVVAWCRLCFGQLQLSRSETSPDQPLATPTGCSAPQPRDTAVDAPMESESGIARLEPDTGAVEGPMECGSSTAEPEDGKPQSDVGSGARCESGAQDVPLPKAGCSETGTPPLLSIVMHLDQPTVVQVLEYHINWFEATGFTPEQGRWFYALLACLEKPLDPEACSLLRRLARQCANLRASLEQTEDCRLAPLNLLIALVARYFEQGDLADNG